MKKTNKDPILTAIDTLNNRFKDLETKFDNKFNALENKFDKKFNALDEKVDSLRLDVHDIKKDVNRIEKQVIYNGKRIDKLGLEIAELQDDSPTREEFDSVDSRVTSIENHLSLSTN